VSTFETVSLLTSVLALVISAVSLFRTRKVAARQLALQEVQTKLAALEHKILVRDVQDRAKADIRVALGRSGNGYKLEVRNVGLASARNLRLRGLNDGDLAQALAGWNADEVFPVPELRPDEVVHVRAMIHLGTKFPIPIVLTWDDESGSDLQREVQIRL
jgi:hypothetical protein